MENKFPSFPNGHPLEDAYSPLDAVLIGAGSAFNNAIGQTQAGYYKAQANLSNAMGDQLMGQLTMNGIAASGLGRMDIPIVKEIQKAGGIPLSLPPETRARMLDQLESEINSRVAASKNVVPALNQPGITTNTKQSPMVNATSSPLSFKTEEEAAAAGLKPGTRITINGVSGRWQ